MVAQPNSPQHTPEEYFAMSLESGDLRLEYDHGSIYAMTGGTPDHSLIEGNLSTWFNILLEARPSCRVHSNDQRVGLPGESYLYPDVSVVCGKQQFEKRSDGQLILLNPLLVVEILSKSTQRFDRIGKYQVYTAMPSVQHYLIVAQTEAHITHYGWIGREWIAQVYNTLTDMIDLAGLGTLPVERAYRKVSWLSDADDF